MKKTSVIVKEKHIYDIDILINNTAYIESITGKTGLLNIKTNEIIGSLDYYYTVYDSSDQLYYQTKKVHDTSNESEKKFKEVIRIYDALNEKMIVDGWEVVKSFKEDYNIISLRSPISGKIYLFDKYAYRGGSRNLFETGFDDVEKFYSTYEEAYFIVTKNGKKGIYCSDFCDKTANLITSIEFDNIEKFLNITVYTKNGKKYFVCDGDDGKRSPEFNDIVLDEQKENIVYCKNADRIYVYNTNSRELLLDEECDDIKYFCYSGKNQYEHRYGRFFFINTKENQKGLLVAETVCNNHEVYTIKTVLLPATYDDIKYDYGVFYPKKNDKTGLLILCYEKNIFVEANYDKIIDLSCDMYAFYCGDRCDIYKIKNSLNLLIENCKIVSSQEDRYIFEKKNSYGIIYQGLNRPFRSDIDVILYDYDSVNYLDNGYYEVGRNGKIGVNFRGIDIVSTEYDTINIKLCKHRDRETVYFALGKNNSGFELAKKKHSEYFDNDVEFVDSQKFDEIKFFDDIMALRTKSNLLIYDYEERLLKKLPVSSQVSMLYRNPDDIYDKKTVYVIDDKIYYSKKRKFEELPFEENDFYVTTYETDTTSFEAKTLDKQEHDAFCNYIDTQAEDLQEQSLNELSADKKVLEKRYPTLILRKVVREKTT